MAVDGGEVDDGDDGDDVDSAEHHRLVESVHEEFPLTRVAPEVPQGLGAGLEGGLRIAHAPILNWLELSEITYEDIGNVPECVVVGVEGGFAEEAPLRLLEAKVHAGEERAADEYISSTMRSTTLRHCCSSLRKASPWSSFFHAACGKHESWSTRSWLQIRY